jgi:predicted secreted acid phosphatase
MAFLEARSSKNFAVIRPYLKNIISDTASVPQRCVVFDIDGTVLFNKPPSYKCSAEENNHIMWLYRLVKKNRIPIFIVTARLESGRAETIEQLNCLGITGYQHLFLRPASYRGSEAVAAYKAHARTIIRNSGYNIILNVGDQWWDLVQLPEKELDELNNYKDNQFVLIAPINELVKWGLKLPSE